MASCASFAYAVLLLGVTSSVCSAVLVSSMVAFAAAVICCTSLILLSSCYLFRVMQIYFCPRTAAVAPDMSNASRHDDEGDNDDAPADDTQALNRAVEVIALPGKKLDVKFAAAVCGCIFVIAVSGIFLDSLSNDSVANNNAVQTHSTQFVLVCLGSILSVALLILMMEMWAAGLLSCGCCPHVVSVPTYLLPQEASRALAVAFAATGAYTGLVVGQLSKTHGISWCSSHFVVVVLTAAAGGFVAGGFLWAYGVFIFLPNFRTNCTPLQRDAYFGAPEAAAHKENLDGIGDSAL